MATATPYTDNTKSQLRSQYLTLMMLRGMEEALDDRDKDIHALKTVTKAKKEKSSPVRIARKGWTKREQIRRPEQSALPLIYHNDTPEIEAVNKGIRTGTARMTFVRESKGVSYLVTPLIDLDYIDRKPLEEYKEHRDIVTPNNNLEGIYSIAEHLGENHKTRFYSVNGERHAQGKGLSGLEKIIYYESALTAQGDACLPHENHSKKHWSKDASQIKKIFACTMDEAERLKKAIDVIGLPTAELDKKNSPYGNKSTPKAWFDEMKKEGRFDAGLNWFENLAHELKSVEGSDEELLDVSSYEYEKLYGEKDEESATQETAVSYHLLDDPRDKETAWEDKPQNAKAKGIIEAIRITSKVSELKKIGLSLFGNPQGLNYTQSSVVWAEYNSRKAHFIRLMKPIVRKGLTRLQAVKDAETIEKAKRWIFSLKHLKEDESKLLWDAWHKAKNTLPKIVKTA